MESSVVVSKHLPSFFRHEARRQAIIVLGHSSHARPRNKVELRVVHSRKHKFHLLVSFVVGSYLEGHNFDVIDHGFDMHQEFLSVPDIIQVFLRVFRVLDSCRVSASDEVSDATVGSGRGMPHDFSRSSIVHRRRPDS